MFHTSNPIIKHKAGLLNLASDLLQNFKTSLKPARLWACRETRFIAIKSSLKPMV